MVDRAMVVRPTEELEADLAQNTQVVRSFWAGLQKVMDAFSTESVRRGGEPWPNERIFGAAQVPGATGHRWFQTAQDEKAFMPTAQGQAHLTSLMKTLRIDNSPEWMDRRSQAERAYANVKSLEKELATRASRRDEAAVAAPAQPDAAFEGAAVATGGDEDAAQDEAVAGAAGIAPARRFWTARRRWSAAGVVLVFIVAAAVGVYVWRDDAGSPGRIINTWSQADKQHKGTYSYDSPFANAHRVSGYPEGADVTLMCQQAHGRTITDPTLKTTSSVWYQTTNGDWVNSNYVALTKVDGKTPQLRAC
ncbi:MAG: hypothetical protein HOV76_11280 [Hamadaea sp.]|nr:hypothetical protein [Hamadaea sp.]